MWYADPRHPCRSHYKPISRIAITISNHHVAIISRWHVDGFFASYHHDAGMNSLINAPMTMMTVFEWGDAVMTNPSPIFIVITVTPNDNPICLPIGCSLIMGFGLLCCYKKERRKRS